MGAIGGSSRARQGSEINDCPIDLSCLGMIDDGASKRLEPRVVSNISKLARREASLQDTGHVHVEKRFAAAVAEEECGAANILPDSR